MVDATFRPFDSMRTTLPLVLLLTLAPAAAQSVTVSSTGISSDGRVLIDPGTGQTRVVPPLLEPWQFGALHAPHKHKAVKPAETAMTADTPPATTPDIAPPPRKHKAAKPVETAETAPRKHKATASVASAEPAVQKPRRTASVTPPPPAPASSGTSNFSGFGDLETLTTAPKPAEPAKPAVKPAPQPKPVAAKPVVAKPATPPPVIEAAKPAPKPEQHASLEPTKPRVSAGKVRDSVVFAPNASDPSGAAVGSVRTLAGSLANALSDATARIQLMAYAGPRGEKSSDTRRLSLKRALVVRQLLIDDGIPAERIDVFALGGADDSGQLDRVDVAVKG